MLKTIHVHANKFNSVAVMRMWHNEAYSLVP